MDYKGTTALITGASAGCGICRQLAQNGAYLVLVPRSQGKLERLAMVKVTVIPTDLGSSDAVDRLISEVKDRGLKIDLLINTPVLESSRASLTPRWRNR